MATERGTLSRAPLLLVGSLGDGHLGTRTAPRVACPLPAQLLLVWVGTVGVGGDGVLGAGQSMGRRVGAGAHPNAPRPKEKRVFPDMLPSQVS